MDFGKVSDHCREKKYGAFSNSNEPDLIIIGHHHGLFGNAGEEEIPLLDIVKILNPKVIVSEGAGSFAYCPENGFYLPEDLKFYDDLEEEMERNSLKFAKSFLKQHMGEVLVTYLIKKNIKIIGSEPSMFQMQQAYAAEKSLDLDDVVHDYDFDVYEFINNEAITKLREKTAGKRIIDSKAEVGIFGNYHIRSDSDLLKFLTQKLKKYLVVDLSKDVLENSGDYIR